MTPRKVFITGLGFITSIGNDKPSVVNRLRSLTHGIVRYPPFAGSDCPVKVLATVKDFEVDSMDFEDWKTPEAYRIKREILRGLAPHGVYAWCAMEQCIADAKLKPEDISNRQTGLYAASGGSPALLFQSLDRMNRAGVMRCNPTGIVASIAGTLNFNLVAGFKILGASCGFSSACASSGHALGFAFEEIRNGRQGRMFVVGGEDCNRESCLPFAAMRALSVQADPDNASRPFDAARDGFVGTGGAVVALLESEDEAQRRGAQPYCEILGWGQGSDGHSVAMSHPAGVGLEEAMGRALASANVEPKQVDYINAHATSTQVGDVSELQAIKAVFGANGSRPWISSTKALTGHGLSLASVMEVGFCALATREGFIPGSANITRLDPAAEGLAILRETHEERPRITLSNSSGFGGANVSIVLRAPDA
ncbi:MAG: beta-ketoacyl-[acyl-carrier-protein] synthase family protein [Opitutaceae bacterium]